MKAKEYLLQLEKLDRLISNKMIEKQQWKEIALGITSHTDGERVRSSGNKSKMADAVDRSVDIEAEIDALVDSYVDTKQEIICKIEKLPAVEYDVLHKLYVQRLDYYDIAAAYGKSYSWATSVHGRALKNLQNILDAKK